MDPVDREIEIEVGAGTIRAPIIEYLGHVASNDAYLAMVFFKGPKLVRKVGVGPWQFWSHEGYRPYARTRGQVPAKQSGRRQRR
jgi:hypothetical protein